MNERITIGIPTKNRTDCLLVLLTSLVLQTYKNFDVVIVDDSDPDKIVDLRTISTFAHIFNLFNRYGINWQVLPGERKGQVRSHIRVLEASKNQWVGRFDDDACLDPFCLEKLIRHLDKDKLGAVASRVNHTDRIFPIECTSPDIEDVLVKLAIQFATFNDLRETSHFYSTFLGRKDLLLDCYPRNLSCVGHSEESTTSYELYLKGYKLLVDGESIVHHFRAPIGGIRTFNNPTYWDYDAKIFRERLRKWNVKLNNYKLVCCNGGIGDLMVLRGLLPKIREKHKGEKIFFSMVYPKFAEDETDIEIASIEAAKILFGEENVNKLDPYRLGYELNGQISLVNVYKKLYGI